MGAPVIPKPDIKYHDRLDMMLHTEEYVDQPCGTVGHDGKKQYCSNECPTLKADLTGK